MDLISYQVAVTQAERAVARRCREGGPNRSADGGAPPSDRRGPVLAALRRRIGDGIVRAGRAIAGGAEPAYGNAPVSDPCRG